MEEKINAGGAWQQRLSALRNVPPVLGIVWQSGRAVVASGLILRLFSALLPVALLAITRLIIDGIVHAATLHQPVPHRFWWLVAGEFSLAILGSVLSRTVDYLDSLLADNYTRHVSIEVMKHAAQLDLDAYEDPVFYDRLERARVQATDRLGMIQSIGRLVQQFITTISLSVSIMFFSPWLLLLLVAGVIPAFLGESHFAFLGYAKNFRQTPIRRQLDYLRIAGRQQGSGQGTEAFRAERLSHGTVHPLSNEIYEKNVSLSRTRLLAGALLSVHRHDGLLLGLRVRHLADDGGRSYASARLTFLAGAILQASNNIQQMFSTLSGIADQALFLTDLLAFLRMQPTIASKPHALPAPRPIVRGFEFRNVSFPYPGSSRLVLDRLNFHLHPGERVALIGENGRAKPPSSS